MCSCLSLQVFYKAVTFLFTMETWTCLKLKLIFSRAAPAWRACLNLWVELISIVVEEPHVCRRINLFPIMCAENKRLLLFTLQHGYCRCRSAGHIILFLAIIVIVLSLFYVDCFFVFLMCLLFVVLYYFAFFFKCICHFSFKFIQIHLFMTRAADLLARLHW